MKRDVSTVEALKQTLLGAESIAQPDASGGAQDGPPTNHTIVAVAPARQRSSEPFRA
jgi:hypothetical protein